MKDCPCHGCRERRTEPNCHDACPISARGEWGYEEWRREMRAKKEHVRKQDEAKAYGIERSERLWKRMGWKRDGQR